MNDRKNAIRELVLTTDISTQEELMEKLKEQGYYVTQSTVSRDMKTLGLVKVKTKKGLCYRLPQQEQLQMGTSILRLDVAENILVLHTHPGLANAVAAAIDHLELPEVLGSIAGDDTILVVARSKEDALVVKTIFREKF